MKLLALRARNVFSISNINLNLDNRGLVLVTGYSEDENRANGAGKSSVSNKALIWGLFGRTPAGEAGAAVRYARADKKSQAWVEVDFEGIDGKTYTIVRTTHPSALVLRQGKTDLTDRKMSNTQHQINHLLSKDFHSFIHADFFGQGRQNSFAELTPSKRREILDDVLPLKSFMSWSAQGAEEKIKIRTEMKEVYTKMTIVDGSVSANEETLKGLNRDFLQWVKNNKRELNNLESSLADNRKSYEECKKNQDEVADLTLRIEKAKIERESVAEAAQSFRKNEVYALEAEKLWQNKDENLESSLSTGPCFECGRALTSKEKVEFTAKRKEAQDQAAQHRAHAEEANKQLQGACINIKAFDEFISDLVVKQQRISTASLTPAVLDAGYVMLESQKNTLLNQSRVNTAPQFKMIQSLNLRLKELEENKISLTEGQDKLDVELRALDKVIAALWVDVPNFALASTCVLLEKATQRHLDGIGNGHIKVKFNMEKHLKKGVREEFNIDVSSGTGAASYGSLSGGEQKMVSFAISLALSDLSESLSKDKSNILILDEPFTNLDSVNSEYIVNYLTGGTIGRSTILLVSNEESLKSLIPNRIHVVKRNGVSQIA